MSTRYIITYTVDNLIPRQMTTLRTLFPNSTTLGKQFYNESITSLNNLEIYMEDISQYIWKKIKEYKPISFSVKDIEHIPTEEFKFGKKEYNRITKERELDTDDQKFIDMWIDSYKLSNKEV